MPNLLENGQQRKREASHWNRYVRERKGASFTIYSNEMLVEERLSIVMDIIQNDALNSMDKETIAKTIIQACFKEEKATVFVQRSNQGENWFVKINRS